ncbi:MAG TPA: hypothetical protein VGB44_07570 [Flavobacterium sp.]|jgi:hypothetical protein
MKKLIFASLISFSALFFGSCDEGPNEDRFESETTHGWVRFERAGDSIVTIGNAQVAIPIVLQAPVNTTGIDVTYTISDVEGNIVNSVVSSGVVTIPQNSREGFINLGLPTNITSCAEFKITLNTTNRDYVSVGLADDSQPVSFNVRLVPSRDMLLGTYDVIEDGQFEYQSVVTAGDAPNELILSNIYDSSPTSQTRVFLNYYDDFSVTFPDFLQNLLFTSTNPALLSVFVDADGDSSFDPCAGTINLNFVLRYGPDQETATDPINVVMTKQ